MCKSMIMRFLPCFLSYTHKLVGNKLFLFLEPLGWRGQTMIKTDLCVVSKQQLSLVRLPLLLDLACKHSTASPSSRAAMAPTPATALCGNAVCRPEHVALVRPRLSRPHSTRSLAIVCQATAIEFTKYQGLGNDFILVDNRHQEELLISPQAAVRLCDRNFGIGGDGVIFALPPKGDVDYTMRIYNSDGSEPEMCGNGIRCLARFVAEKDNAGPRQYKVSTGAGLIQPDLLEDGQVCVDMGEPILEAERIPTTLPATQGSTAVQAPLQVAGQEWLVTCVSMGNPHAVVFGTKQGNLKLSDIDVRALGPQFETNSVFPKKTNTHFVEVLDKGHVQVSVWERGAGQTLACGTGACAIVVAGVLEGQTDRTCQVDLPGGPLIIEWRESDNHIYMTGPAELAFRGVTEV